MSRVSVRSDEREPSSLLASDLLTVKIFSVFINDTFLRLVDGCRAGSTKMSLSPALSTCELIAAIIIHIILKMLLKESRPPEYYETPSTYPEWMESTFNKYGMPSGHSQVIGFLSSFIWFYTKNISFLIVNLLLSIITMYQRVAIKRHTLKQVIYGYSIGWLIGYFFTPPRIL